MHIYLLSAWRFLHMLTQILSRTRLYTVASLSNCRCTFGTPHVRVHNVSHLWQIKSAESTVSLVHCSDMHVPTQGCQEGNLSVNKMRVGTISASPARIASICLSNSCIANCSGRSGVRLWWRACGTTLPNTLRRQQRSVSVAIHL